MRRILLKRVGIMLVVVFLAGIVGGCGSQNQAKVSLATDSPTVLAAEFSPYREIAVDERASLKPYTVAADLSNVSNGERFQFSPEAKQKLVQNGFVVLPGFYQEYFGLYEVNRYDMIPNFVTTDAMLHNYHLFFNHLLKTVEGEELLPCLKKLNSGMQMASERQYQELKNTAWANAARRNLAFFSVGNRLLDPGASVPAGVRQEVEAELKLIDAHQQGMQVSPVMSIGQKSDVLESLKEDYTQYIPRGHYTGSDKLKAYFKAMMWYGRMTFRLKSEDETRSAVLMTLALKDPNNLAAWDKIGQTTKFFVGESDDLGYTEYYPLLQKVYGNDLNPIRLSKDNTKWQAFMKEAAKLKGPAINSIPVFDASIQPDREREIKGFRFMGQCYTVDADIFQRLVYREVGENKQGERRTLPQGLDIPAAMGSSAAKSILKQMGQYEFQNYPDNMGKLEKYLSGLQAGAWQKNLYWSWMNTLKPLTIEKPQGYPSFMLNQAWQRKELNTYLGSWTELKHDTILYAKQVYAEAGGGGEEKVDDRGFVEPNPHLYARLAALTAMTREGLQSRNLLNQRDAESLQRLEKLALELKTISEKELQGKSLSDEEYELIRSFGVQLEHFWLETLRDQTTDGGNGDLLNNNPAMLVADVATAPPDKVLEEATGYIHQIYAVVPVAGSLRIAKGGVYSYYEFPWPAADRLTDEKWREMLFNQEFAPDEGSAGAKVKVPEPPSWTNSFRVKGECRVKMPWDNQ